MLTANGLSRRLYYAAREIYHFHDTRQLAKAAERYFLNADEFKRALGARGGAVRRELVDLRTMDGLTITMRRSYTDAITVGEVLLTDSYVRDLTLPSNPVVIDVGGFIGDFSLYAVKKLNARRVIVCEPSPRNFELLLKNIANNGYEDIIELVNKAVTDGRNLMMNTDAPDEYQCMVSGHIPSEQLLSNVPGISLGQLLRDHAVERVDLLKIDCEGGEFEILESMPGDVFGRIRNIVFEYHQVGGKLKSVKQLLRREGYSLRPRGGLISASRL